MVDSGWFLGCGRNLILLAADGIGITTIFWKGDSRNVFIDRILGLSFGKMMVRNHFFGSPQAPTIRTFDFGKNVIFNIPRIDRVMPYPL
jgi:hypothetical protein